MVLRCRMAQTLFEEYLLGTLNPTTKAQLEEHLAGCPACGEALQQLGNRVGFVSPDVVETTAPAAVAGSASRGAKPMSDAKSASRSAASVKEPMQSAGFVPQANSESTVVRRRLEEMGVLFPDPQAAQNSAVLKIPVAEKEPASSGEEQPLQQLLRRFGDSGTVMNTAAAPPAASTAVTATAASATFEGRAKSFTPFPGRSPLTMNEEPTTATNQVASSVAPLTAATTPEPMPVTPTAPLTPEPLSAEEDRNDEQLWVEIEVTHHVTQRQIRKRVRRDSAEAQRYLQQLAENAASKELSLAEIEIEPSDSAQTSATLPPLLQPSLAPLPQEILSVPPSPVQDTQELLPIEEALAIFSQPEAAVSEAHVPEIVLEDDTAQVQDAQADTPIVAVEELALTDELTVNQEILEPPLIQTANDEDIPIVLPEYYGEAVKAQPRPEAPPQRNPIVRRPAELGRERLVSQSRLIRDERQVVVREPGTATIPAHTFVRMRWLEKIRRNQVVLLAVVIVLAVLTVFLFGMLITALNSPQALARRATAEEINMRIRDIAAALQLGETFLQTNDPVSELSTSLGQRILAQDGIVLHRQEQALSVLTSQFHYALLAWKGDVLAERQVDEAEDFREQMLAALSPLREHLEKKRFPLTDQDWRKTEQLMEPVATLALRYWKTGSMEEVSVTANLSIDHFKERLDALQEILGEDVQLVSCDFYPDLRERKDRWELCFKGVSWGDAEGYELVVGDDDAMPLLLTALGEYRIICREMPDDIESFSSALLPGDSRYYLIDSVADVTTGSHDFYLAPVRGLKIFPEEPLLLRLDAAGGISDARRLLPTISTEAVEVPVIAIDLFTAAHMARQYLVAPGATVSDETTLIADFSQGTIGEPRISWFYRGKIDGIWRSVIIEEERIVAFEDYLVDILLREAQ